MKLLSIVENPSLKRQQTCSHYHSTFGAQKWWLTHINIESTFVKYKVNANHSIFHQTGTFIIIWCSRIGAQRETMQQHISAEKQQYIYLTLSSRNTLLHPSSIFWNVWRITLPEVITLTHCPVITCFHNLHIYKKGS